MAASIHTAWRPLQEALCPGICGGRLSPASIHHTTAIFILQLHEQGNSSLEGAMKLKIASFCSS